jgi:hypothetical protein
MGAYVKRDKTAFDRSNPSLDSTQEVPSVHGFHPTGVNVTSAIARVAAQLACNLEGTFPGGFTAAMGCCRYSRGRSAGKRGSIEVIAIELLWECLV